MKKGIVLAIVVLLAASAITGIWFFRQGTADATTANVVKNVNNNAGVKEFKVDAVRFDYTPNTLTVKKGDKVKITINNVDTMHGIRIPDLDVRGNAVLEFTADKKGEFTWYCNTFCGEGHTQMKGRLIVE